MWRRDLEAVAGRRKKVVVGNRDGEEEGMEGAVREGRGSWRGGESLGTSKVTIPSVCLPSCHVLKQIYFLIMNGSPWPCYLQGGKTGGDRVGAGDR